eukprot:8355792-Pyramimonas_sp.AAC.1
MDQLVCERYVHKPLIDGTQRGLRRVWAEPPEALGLHHCCGAVVLCPCCAVAQQSSPPAGTKDR